MESNNDNQMMHNGDPDVNLENLEAIPSKKSIKIVNHLII